MVVCDCFWIFETYIWTTYSSVKNLVSHYIIYIYIHILEQQFEKIKHYLEFYLFRGCHTNMCISPPIMYIYIYLHPYAHHNYYTYMCLPIPTAHHLPDAKRAGFWPVTWHRPKTSWLFYPIIRPMVWSTFLGWIAGWRRTNAHRIWRIDFSALASPSSLSIYDDWKGPIQFYLCVANTLPCGLIKQFLTGSGPGFDRHFPIMKYS